MSTEITVGTPAMIEIDITNRGSTVGPQGIQGIQGVQGPAGAAGSNASVTQTAIEANYGVTRLTAQTLVNKTLESVTLTGGTIVQTTYGNGNTSYTVLLPFGSIQTIILNNASACVLSLPAPVAGRSFSLCVKWTLASGSITWPASVRWSGGVAPTLTKVVGKADFFMFHCPDCMYWYGQTIGMNYPQ